MTSVKPGDHVIPLYTPECRQCKSCLRGKTNLCTAIRATQGKGADARRHQPLQLQGPDDLPLYGLLDLLELHRPARDRGREDPRGRAVPDQLLYRLRRHHRRRRGGQHRQGRSRATMSSCSASAASASTSSRARSWSARTGSSASTSIRTARNGAASFGMTHFVNAKGMSREDDRRADRRADRRRRRLYASTAPAIPT